MYFEYGKKELDWLGSRDRLLGEAIEKIGPVYREVEDDIFTSVIHHIVGQQISGAAQATIWRRMGERFGSLDAAVLGAAEVQELQSLGMTFRKAGYIKDFAARVADGTFDIQSLAEKSDEQVAKELSSLHGIGVWTAEMLMLFCLRRTDILSYGDLAIHRGMRMLYHHRHIDKKLFERYRRRYSPYGSVASIYLWAIAGGAIEGMKDYAVKRKAVKK